MFSETLELEFFQDFVKEGYVLLIHYSNSNISRTPYNIYGR
jgi:hypothetical protein